MKGKGVARLPHEDDIGHEAPAAARALAVGLKIAHGAPRAEHLQRPAPAQRAAWRCQGLGGVRTAGQHAPHDEGTALGALGCAALHSLCHKGLLLPPLKLSAARLRPASGL